MVLFVTSNYSYVLATKTSTSQAAVFAAQVISTKSPNESGVIPAASAESIVSTTPPSKSTPYIKEQPLSTLTPNSSLFSFFKIKAI